QPYNYLGKIFMSEGNAPQAIAQFEQALPLHPDFPEAEENLRLAKASDPQLPSQSPQLNSGQSVLRRDSRSPAGSGNPSANDGWTGRGMLRAGCSGRCLIGN